MEQPHRTAPGVPASRFAWLLLGVGGWLGVAMIGMGLGARVGDDLRLLVEAGRHWSAGLPLYDAVGSGLDATTLFFSYPPVVAQAFSLVAGLPFEAILVGWGVAAVAAFALVVRRLAPALLLPVLAVVPFAWPYSIALLFGNANAWFPVVFGLVLLAGARPNRGTVVAAGVALAIGAAAKLHPATLILFLLVRGTHAREERRAAWGTAGVALTAGAAILAGSLLAGGGAPWLDWFAFLGGSSGNAEIVSRLNIGPASVLAGFLGAGDAGARTIQAGVTIAALLVTLLAAWRVRDRVTASGWAIAASLVILPVTWYHYPAALVPVAVAAIARRSGAPAPRRVLVLAAIAVPVAALSIAAPVAVWAAVGLVLAAAHLSSPGTEPTSTESAGHPLRSGLPAAALPH